MSLYNCLFRLILTVTNVYVTNYYQLLLLLLLILIKC